MRIRHLVALDNVDAAGFVIDPLLTRHGLVVGGRIAALAGPIEAATHLNLDAPEHRLQECLVAEQLAEGAPLLWDGDHFRLAGVRAAAFCRLGPINLDARRAEWQQKLQTQN